MEFKKLISTYDSKTFIIEEDLPDIGAYLYVFENDTCVYDSVQDNLRICIDVAFEKYQVPRDSWKDAEND